MTKKQSKIQAIISDIDGCIACSGNARKCLTRCEVCNGTGWDIHQHCITCNGHGLVGDWKAYNRMVGTEKPNLWYVDMLTRFATYHKIIFVTARNHKLEKKTIRWLHDVLPSIDWILFTREKDDLRSGPILKKEIYRSYIEPFYNVKYAFDDSNEICKMWMDIGIPSLQVRNG